MRKQFILDIADRLKISRQLRGYSSQRQFALASNIHVGTYRYHETGETEPSIKDLLFYARQLKTSLRWLLLGMGEPSELDALLDTMEFSTIESRQQIGQRIEVARKAFGYKTRDSFAKACQINTTTLRFHEIGQVEIGIASLLLYRHELSLSLHWLLTGQGPPIEYPSDPQLLKKSEIYEDLINTLYSAAKQSSELNALHAI
jgi:DNA-binding XRE family transcriptional regulator